MYQIKKKRPVDPNAPPRPSLLGHEKEMKTWRQQFGQLAQQNTEQTITINALERKVNRLQAQMDALVSHYNRRASDGK
jgi:DNA/RNA-binding domain of Phe-tRNA-synthetase-like protein